VLLVAPWVNLLLISFVLSMGMKMVMKVALNDSSQQRKALKAVSTRKQP